MKTQKRLKFATLKLEGDFRKNKNCKILDISRGQCKDPLTNILHSKGRKQISSAWFKSFDS